MKLSAVILSLAIAASAAPFNTNTTSIIKREDFGIPKCALECIRSALAIFECSEDDLDCACANAEGMKNKAGPCVVKSCGLVVTNSKVAPILKALCS